MTTVKQRMTMGQRVGLTLAVFLASLSAGAQTGRIPLPDMGNSASTILTDRQEAEYAKGLIRQLRAFELLVEDPQIEAFFSDMGFRLVARSDGPDKPFTFLVMDEPNVNAFAAPGGVVVLHTGLILAADNEHEVAGVLSHEIAHITQLHLYRAFEKAKRMSLPLALAMLGMIIAGGGGGDVVTGAVMSGQAMAQQMQINFTRHNETEADRIGIRTLAEAGYDPDGMASFFGKLNRLTRANGEGPPEFLRTHPVTVNRIAEARNRAANLPEPKTGDGSDFYLMQSRLRALTEDDPKVAVQWFREQLESDPSEARRRGLQYGLAIALQRRLEHTQSRALLRQLLEEEPNRLAYQLQLADLDLVQGELQAAIDRLGSLYHNFPGNHAIAVQYSEALMKSEEPQQAETAAVILRQQLLQRENDPGLYALYARAANLAGDRVRATEAIAESYFQRGSVPEAIEQLERLSNDPDLDYYQRARVEARLMQIRLQLDEKYETRREG